MPTLDEINNQILNIKSYRPLNETVFDGKGNIVSRTDTREVLGEIALKLLEVRDRASKEINYLVPPFKQANLGAGIYDEEKSAYLRSLINSCRDKATACENELILADSLDKVERVVYNYDAENADVLNGRF